MNKIKLIVIAITTLLSSAFVTYTVVNWKVKEDYYVQVYKGGTKFVTFRGLKAKILFDETKPEKSKISASIESNSIDAETNLALMQGAKKPETLDVEKFPLISFESTAIIKTTTGYEATGKLTLKGISKEIKLAFIFENQIFEGGFTIIPQDFNITGEAFQKNLNIVLHVPVTK
jgi:polyisoprenoid-binding protein YceI